MSKQPAKKPVVRKTAAKKVALEKASPKKARKMPAKSAKKVSVDVVPTNVAEAVAAVETKKGNSKDSPVSHPPVAAVGFSLDDVRSILDRKKDAENEKDEPVAGEAKRKAKATATSKPVKSFAKNKTKSASVVDILGFNPKKSATRPPTFSMDSLMTTPSPPCPAFWGNSFYNSCFSQLLTLS